MIRLLSRFGWPYRRLLAVVLVLVTVQALTNLYLPNLNADIINNGVLKGDTNYIVRIGALMLFVTLPAGPVLDRIGLLRLADLDVDGP